jgi:manganese/iron transport system substrate-binding protein
MTALRRFVPLWVIFSLLAACATPTPTAAPQTQKLRVLATTTIVGDVVSNIAGDAVELSVLLPVGADPHAFTPTPQDVAKVSQADVVFANGAGLEEFLAALLESAGAAEKVVAVSEGIALLPGHAHSHGAEGEHSHEGEHTHEGEQAHEGEHTHEGEQAHEGEHTHEGEQAHEGEHTHEGEQAHEGKHTHEGEQAHEGEHTHEHEHAAGDPHTWFDPNLVMVWVENIAKTLSEKDPQNAATYQKNAADYTAQLRELDQWIRQQVETIPPENRQLVTDHKAFGYFAERYGFTQVGAVLPGFSTLAEPSAQELAALEDAIRQQGVKAIFVGTTINPNLAQRVADDTGVKLVYLYTGSLSEKDGPASTYLDFMRYNVNAIVEALK